jgi:hypothetical protein
MLEFVVELNKKLNGNIQTMVPCLYGYSGTGKTTRVRELADKLGLELEVILLHSMLSEEVCGLPRYDSKSGKTKWTLPEWFDPVKPKCYFIDELDKVREDELGLLLTIFASKEIRGIPFPKESIIVCAMQPIIPETWTETETGQALISRLLFIPVENNTTTKHLEKKYNIDLSFIPNKDIAVPMLPVPNGRQIEYFLGIVSQTGVDKAKEVCKYMIEEKFMIALTESLNKNFGINKEDFVKRLNNTPEKIKNFDIYQLIENIGWIWHHGNSQLVSEAMEKIILEGTFDEYDKMIKSLYDYFDQNIEENGTLEIINGESEEVFYETFKKKMDKVAKILTKREKNGKKQQSNGKDN